MRIAIVGGGIAGLGAAYVLSRTHEVELFERETRAGGHANTVVRDGIPLDTGFLVHNTPNYPLLCRLFTELGVRTHESEMSFSVSCDDCGLEYSGRRPFAQARNAASPRFHALLWEIGRWLRTAGRSLDEADYETASLGDYLDARGYSRRFRSHFLVPLTAALWSTAPGRALEFPAAYAIRFFDNHGMLGFGRFRWRTVTGGSRVYVEAISDRLGAGLGLGEPCAAVRRRAPGGGPHGGRHGATVRQGRRRDARRRGSGAARGSERRRSAVRSADSRTPSNETVLHTDSSLPAAGAGGARLLELPDGRRRAARP